MIGFGVTLPVLPFYAERLALAGGASREGMVIHVGLLTSVYVLMQFFFAPLWGRWSDRIGRRPLILLGITGYAIAQLLFGAANSLALLYGARVLGGVLSSATLPGATAYVADVTTEGERSRGMAWMGAATSLGVVVGPALGGIFVRKDLHFTMRYGHFMIDSFSIPFFVAAALAFLTLVIAIRWLPESLHSRASDVEQRLGEVPRDFSAGLKPLLFLTLAAQFGLAIFEATFALYAREVLAYGPAEVGSAFIVCGLVMAIFQLGITGYLTKFVSEFGQIAAGFTLMGVSLALLLIARTTASVLGIVGLLALGMALVTPNLLTLTSRRGGRRTGAALGAQNAANSLGQASGPLLGSVLFAWRVEVPYLLAGAMLLIIGSSTGWLARRGGGTLSSERSSGKDGRRET
jgi:DHA1 family multidrug resistance protein-like MFS transporter